MTPAFETTLIPALVLFVVALGLFATSVVADRLLWLTTAEWSFNFSSYALWGSMFFMIWGVVLDEPPPTDVLLSGPIATGKWMVSELGGWSLSFAWLNFCGAAAAGVMFLLARFVDAVEPAFYGFGALYCVVVGMVFMTGFIPFFKGVALILGIIASIVGILVGIKTLQSQK